MTISKRAQKLQKWRSGDECLKMNESSRLLEKYIQKLPRIITKMVLMSPELYINKISEVSLKCVSLIYKKGTPKHINNEIVCFVNNISIVAIGTIIGSIFSFVFNVVSGRVLGPDEYGKFTLISSISMFLYIPMIFGISTAMVKYSSEKIEFNRQQKIISTSYVLICITTVASILSYYLLSAKIALAFDVDLDFIHMSIIFAILFSLYTLTTNTLRSLHDMKMVSKLQLIYGLIPLILFELFFIQAKDTSFMSMLIPISISYLIISGIIIVHIRKYLKFSMDKYWTKILIKYSSFNIFSSVSCMLYTNIDKILINKYMQVNYVGLYNAYNFSSITIMSLFSGIIVTVLFPTVSKYENKREVILFFNKFLPYFAVLGLPAIFVLEYFVLKLYGNNYPINLSLMLLFAIASLLFFSYEIYVWIFNSVGVEGVKLTICGTCTIAIVNILLNICLIPHFGLHGAIGSTIIAYFIGMFVVYKGQSRHL